MATQHAKGALLVSMPGAWPPVMGNCIVLSLLTLVLAELLKVPEPHYAYRAQTNDYTILDVTHRVFDTYRHTNHVDLTIPACSNSYPYELSMPQGRVSAIEDFLLYPVCVQLFFQTMSRGCNENLEATRGLVDLFNAARDISIGIFGGDSFLAKGSFLIKYGLRMNDAEFLNESSTHVGASCAESSDDSEV